MNFWVKSTKPIGALLAAAGCKFLTDDWVIASCATFCFVLALELYSLQFDYAPTKKDKRLWQENR